MLAWRACLPFLRTRAARWRRGNSACTLHIAAHISSTLALRALAAKQTLPARIALLPCKQRRCAYRIKRSTRFALMRAYL